MSDNMVIIVSNGHQYSRHSFDRFGDDLTELILSFMSFEDQTRLQFVCRQWQRCIFEKTSELTIIRPPKESMSFLKRINKRISKSINSRAMISYVTNCRNITRVTLEYGISDEFLSLIGQYCPHIRSLDYRGSDVKALPFFRDCGHKLQELDMTLNNINIKPYLNFCPNLKIINLRFY